MESYLWKFQVDAFSKPKIWYRLSFSRFAKFSKKTNISYSLIRTRTHAYRRVRNFSFSYNLADLLNQWFMLSLPLNSGMEIIETFQKWPCRVCLEVIWWDHFDLKLFLMRFFHFVSAALKKNWSVNPKLLVKLIFAKHWVKRADTWQEAFINPSFRNTFLCNGIDLFDSLSDFDASPKNGLLKCRTFNRKETVYVKIA